MILKIRAWIRCSDNWDEIADKNAFEMVDADSLAFEEFLPLSHLLEDKPDEAYYMLFTGKHDKNGVEIYKSDIVITGKGVCVVTFDNGCFYTQIGDSKYRLGGWKTVQVIGNIYENPELLKQ